MAKTVLGNCRSCDANVFWLMNAGSRKIAPIDAMPVKADEGSIEVNLEQGTYEVHSDPKKRQQLAGAGVAFFRNHFQTCPDQARWRERQVQRAGV